MKPQKLVIKNGRRVLIDYDTKFRKEHDKDYNRRRSLNKSEYVRFYKSSLWKKTRAQVLARDFALCQRCGMEAKLVDHIIPSEDDWKDRTNLDNLESLCTNCHKLKTKREWIKKHKGKTRRMIINVVVGYPAAGKTTYVKQHIGSNDLVYDYDALMQALTFKPEHEDNIDVNDYIQLFYELILRKINSEQTFDNVWIVLSYPDERLDSLLVSHTVKHIYIDTPKKICIERLTKQGRNINQLNDVMNKIDILGSKGKLDKYRRVLGTR